MLINIQIFANDLYIGWKPFAYDNNYYLSCLVVSQENEEIEFKINNQKLLPEHNINGKSFDLDDNINFYLFYVQIGQEYSSEQDLEYMINREKYIIKLPKSGQSPNIMFLTDNSNIQKWQKDAIQKIEGSTHLLCFLGSAITMDNILIPEIEKERKVQDKEFESLVAKKYFERYIAKKECKVLATKPSIYNINKDHIYEIYRISHNRSHAGMIMYNKALKFFRIFCLHDLGKYEIAPGLLLKNNLSSLISFNKITLLTVDMASSAIILPEFYTPIVAHMENNKEKMEGSHLIISIISPIYDLIAYSEKNKSNQKDLLPFQITIDGIKSRCSFFNEENLFYFLEFLVNLKNKFKLAKIVLLNSEKNKTQKFEIEIKNTKIELWDTSGAFPQKFNHVNYNQIIDFKISEHKIEGIIKYPAISLQSKNNYDTKFSLVKFFDSTLEMELLDENYETPNWLSRLFSNFF